jgi:nucleosome assembly protein 1-like 1
MKNMTDAGTEEADETAASAERYAAGEATSTKMSLTEDDKIQEVMDAAKDMKISELKLKLMAKGILTSTFCEKHEFVRAYAQQVVKEQQQDQRGEAHTWGDTNDYNEDSNGNEDDDEDDDEDHGTMDKLPEYMKQRVDVLKKMNDDREDIMKEYLSERARLEAKYHRLVEPLYEKRKDIILGKLDEEIVGATKDQDQLQQERGGTTISTTTKKEKGIPQFWVVAISQMPVTAELVTEHDVDCLGNLEDIRCMDYENGEGFNLEFHFAPNEYFENTVLTKSYDVPNLLLADEPILKNVEGCDIQWKPGMCLTQKEVTKTQRGKGKNAGQTRTVTKTERFESFFHFFSPPKMPSLESMDEEQAARLEAAFDEDYDVAQAFRSHIVPKAVMWFAGDAMEKEMEAAMEGMEFPTSTTADGGENPECKQS